MTAITVANRSVTRLALAALLRSTLVGTGKPVNKVYDEPIADFHEQVSVHVESAGSDHPEAGTSIGGNTTSVFDFRVHVFVIWPLPNGSAETTLDLIEKMIAVMVKTNKKATSWKNLKYNGSSNITLTPDFQYRHEVIPLRAEVND